MTLIQFINTDLSKINQNPNKSFLNSLTGLLIGDDKTKRIIFGIKHKLAKFGSFDIRYSTIHIYQYHIVTDLGCSVDKNLSIWRVSGSESN